MSAKLILKSYKDLNVNSIEDLNKKLDISFGSLKQDKVHVKVKFR